MGGAAFNDPFDFRPPASHACHTDNIYTAVVVSRATHSCAEISYFTRIFSRRGSPSHDCGVWFQYRCSSSSVRPLPSPPSPLPHPNEAVLMVREGFQYLPVYGLLLVINSYYYSSYYQ